MIDYFLHWTGNFGLAILIVTVLVKLLFFPLGFFVCRMSGPENRYPLFRDMLRKSYASMAKMKAVQPEMANIRERKTHWFVAQS